MPNREVREGMRLQERVLLAGARLSILPPRPQHVLMGIDQPLRVHNRILVQHVGGDPPILPQHPRCRGPGLPTGQSTLLARLPDHDAVADGAVSAVTPVTVVRIIVSPLPGLLRGPRRRAR
jgi:hypothetical protein